MPVTADEAKGWYALLSAALGLIAGVFGAGAIFQRLRDRLQKVESAVLDDKTCIPIVVTTDECQKKMVNCIAERRDRRAEDRDNLARELQNVHAAIAHQRDQTEELKKSVAAMPLTIAKELRDMGVLK